jgi:hypothetical protein
MKRGFFDNLRYTDLSPTLIIPTQIFSVGTSCGESRNMGYKKWGMDARKKRKKIINIPNPLLKTKKTQGERIWGNLFFFAVEEGAERAREM